MRRALVFVAGVALLLLALAAMAPASLIDGRLDALSAGTLRLANASGTVWKGAGELRVPPANAGIPVAWNIDTWPLLWRELRGTLSTNDDASTPASFMVGAREGTLRNVAIAVPARTLEGALGVPVALVAVSGSVGMRIGQMTWGSNRVDGDIALRWDQAALQAAAIGPGAPVRIALGDVRFEGTGQGNAIAGTLANVGGDVEISGTASIALDGVTRIDALVRPRAGIDAERAKAIGAALGAVGQPDGSGAFRVTRAR